MSDVWAKWEGQIINGVFPLRRLLGVSNHSGVFLTEYKTRGLPDAAIKLFPARSTEADSQLAQWRAIAALAHPRLMRLIAMGRCQLDGQQFLFVVMEYGEQNLSQILAHRALTADEVREMLPPILEALAFLHGHHQVQGRLRPSNILAVGDQLKLASDTIRPETDGKVSAQGDIFSLGTTIVEALGQHPGIGPDGRFDSAALSRDFPAEFAELVRQCVHPDPARRPSSAQLLARFKAQPQPATAIAPPPASPSGPTPAAPTPATPATTAPSPPLASPTAPTAAAASPPSPVVPPPDVPLPAASAQARPSQVHPTWRWYVAGLGVALIIWLAVWASTRGHHSEKKPPPPAASTEPAPPPPTPAAPPTRADPWSVLHEEIPEISSGARGTIHGRIQVSVRVTLDAAGNVVGVAVTIPGSSRYFARKATDAAMKWKFAPADDHESRKRLLIFEFARDGVSAHAEAPRS
jgi:serine/threonine protein kinase